MTRRVEPMPVLEAAQCEDCMARIKYDVEYDASTPLCSTCGHLRLMSVTAPSVEEWLDPTLEIVISRAYEVTEVPDHAPWMSLSYKKGFWKGGQSMTSFEDV